MRQNTMFHAHLAAQSARETEKEWETAGKQEFVIVFRQTGGVFLF